MNETNTAYLFDVDGVLTNSQSRTISNPEIITAIISKLQHGNPVGLISGRGLIWLRSRVVKVFENYLGDHPGFDPRILDNLYVSGEFGGVKDVHINGQRTESVNKELILPQGLRSALELRAQEFSEYVTIETEKQTIFTLLYNQDSSESIAEHKEEIISSLQPIIVNYPDLEIHSDSTAMNIKYKKANKGYVTQQFITWVSEKGLTPQKYYAFGDSQSDFEIGEELHNRSFPFEFIFVGEESGINKDNLPFPITITKGHADEGTLEFLNSRGQNQMD